VPLSIHSYAWVAPALSDRHRHRHRLPNPYSCNDTKQPPSSLLTLHSSLFSSHPQASYRARLHISERTLRGVSVSCNQALFPHEHNITRLDSTRTLDPTPRALNIARSPPLQNHRSARRHPILIKLPRAPRPHPAPNRRSKTPSRPLYTKSRPRHAAAPVQIPPQCDVSYPKGPAPARASSTATAILWHGGSQQQGWRERRPVSARPDAMYGP
jgi:hypothetical protein